MVTKVLSLATPPEVLQLQVGNTCRVEVNYDYSGPQVPAKIRVAIGRVGVFGFDEVVYKVVSIIVPDTPEKKTYQTPVDIYISSAMKVQPGYDLYAKIVDIPGADIYSPTYHNVIEISEEVPPAEYTLEVAIEPPGAGLVSVSPSKATYPAGEVVTLTATPNPGYEFDHWGGWPPYPGVGSTSPSIQITMDANWWVVAAFREVAPVTTVTVKLKNPPAGAELWYLTLTDWNATVPIRELRDSLINVTETATFEVPSGLSLPLRVVQLQIVKWNADHTAVIQLYYMQSYKPFLWDWDLMDYGTEPDPTYREIFIPALGIYSYNVATETFE